MMYDRKCNDCGFIFEVMEPMNELDNKISCPCCLKNDTKRVVIHSPSFIIKGYSYNNSERGKV